MYLGWFDDNPKKGEKITDAIAAYVARFRVQPTIVLVGEDAPAVVAGVAVRREGYVRRNNFWVGLEGV